MHISNIYTFVDHHKLTGSDLQMCKMYRLIHKCVNITFPAFVVVKTFNLYINYYIKIYCYYII